MDQKHLDLLQNIGFNVIVFDENTPTYEAAMSEDQENTMLTKLAEGFEIAKNAVMDSSSIRKELSQVKIELSSLTSKVTQLTFDNQGYEEAIKMRDNAIIEARTQRNTAQAEANNLRQENSNLSSAFNAAKREMLEYQRQAGELSNLCESLRQENTKQADDYLKLVSEHDQLKQKLAGITDLLGIKEVKAEVTSDPLPITDGSGQASGQAGSASSTPSTMPPGEPEKPAGEFKSEGATEAHGEVWPSHDQPRDPLTGWYQPRKKDEQVQ